MSALDGIKGGSSATLREMIQYLEEAVLLVQNPNASWFPTIRPNHETSPSTIDYEEKTSTPTLQSLVAQVDCELHGAIEVDAQAVQGSLGGAEGIGV